MTFRIKRSWLARAAGCAIALALAARADAQSPPAGPLLLRLPASTRAAALGNAWVAGRDEDVVFYNPAQLIGGVRGGFNATYAHYGVHGSVGSLAFAYAAGPSSLTIGWGVQFADYGTRPEIAYPYTPSVLAIDGNVDAYSVLMTAGTAIVFKGFRVGIAGKFASDRVDIPSLIPPGPVDTRHDALLGDAGLAHTLLGGIAAVSVQNIGTGPVDGTRQIEVPLQALAGWSAVKQWGPFDVGLYGQVAQKKEWTSPGGGIELGYGWIEGYSFALRAGGRRTEPGEERPASFGASFTGDHLTLDYAYQSFEGGRAAHRVTLRWR